MPSPVGHALAGLAGGWLVDAATRAGRSRSAEAEPHTPPAAAAPAFRSRSLSPRLQALLFAGLACLPDIDFLFDAHSAYTHSVGAMLIVGTTIGIAFRDRRLAAAAAAAYGSHIVLDWLGQDTTPPLGVMALWPFSDAYYISKVPLMMAISRRYWLPNFWMHNLAAVGMELAFLAPLAAAAWWIRARSGRGVLTTSGKIQGSAHPIDGDQRTNEGIEARRRS